MFCFFAVLPFCRFAVLPFCLFAVLPFCRFAVSRGKEHEVSMYIWSPAKETAERQDNDKLLEIDVEKSQ